MKKVLAMLFGAALASSALGQEKNDTCRTKMSTAMCILTEARLNIGLKDADGKKVSEQFEKTGSSGMWELGAIAGVGTGFFTTAPGTTKGGEVGLLLAGWLLSGPSEPTLSGQTLLVAWVPRDVANSESEAEAVVAREMDRAYSQVFSKHSMVPLVDDFAPALDRDQTQRKKMWVGYEVTGPGCDQGCRLVRRVDLDSRGRWVRTEKAPQLMGAYESWAFVERAALPNYIFQVNGVGRTADIAAELSHALPEWIWLVVGPESKRAKYESVGNRITVLYNKGKPHLPVFPEIDDRIVVNGQKR